MSADGYRLCVRLSDAFAGPTPGSVEDHCVRCGQAVWVDITMKLTAAQANLPPVCGRCVLADRELASHAAPEILADLVRLHYWADRLRPLQN